MQRINIGAEMIQAIRDGRLIEWWKENSPNRPERYPWQNIYELPYKRPEEMSGIIEVIGPSGAGKSNFLEYYGNNSKTEPLEIFPELVIRNEDGGKENWSHGEDSEKMQKIMAAEFGIKGQMLVWNQIKLMTHLQAEVHQLQNNKSSILLERGTNDGLCTSVFTQPQHYSTRYDQIFGDKWLSNILLSVTLAQSVDAVVLFGTTWQETRKRRLQQGSSAEGKYINKKNWPEIMSGYKWWLGSFYPMFRRTNGMGLLIIDGTQPLEANNKKITSYCDQVFSMRKS